MIEWQWVINKVESFLEEPEKKKAGYQEEDHEVKIYRVTGDVIRIDIKTQEQS